MQLFYLLMTPLNHLTWDFGKVTYKNLLLSRIGLRLPPLYSANSSHTGRAYLNCSINNTTPRLFSPNLMTLHHQCVGKHVATELHSTIFGGLARSSYSPLSSTLLLKLHISTHIYMNPTLKLTLLNIGLKLWPWESRTFVSHVFIAARKIIARNWKQDILQDKKAFLLTLDKETQFELMVHRLLSGKDGRSG